MLYPDMIDFISNFAILILIITGISFAVKLLKQPIILGYVLAGLMFAYFIQNDAAVNEQLFIFSEIGITFLLFLMGIEFDLKGLKYFGKDVFIASLMQSIAFFLGAFLLALPFGFSVSDSIYLGILFMFSSTLLAAKWIDDKKETNTLHGKITLSILIIQDLFAIIILTVLSILKESSPTKIFLIPIEGMGLLLIAFVLSKYLLNKPLKMSSKYPELLFLASLSVCFGFVSLAPVFGYSTTIGAFIGGVVLANTLYKADILTRVKPLVLFFNMLFFVGLGFQVNLSMNSNIFMFIAALCCLSLVLKPIVVYITLRLRGYDMKTSFLSGIYLSQLSEFGIIIIAGAVASELVDGFMGSIAVISVISSMILSSYLIKSDKTLYKFFERFMVTFDKRFIVKEVKVETQHYDANILFFGYFDLGLDRIRRFEKMGKRVLFVENDPENLALLRGDRIPCVYNSINNPDFFEHLSFHKVDVVVSNLSDLDENEMLLKEMKKYNPKALVIVTAKHLKDSIELYKLGADYVIYTPNLREEKVSVILDDYASDLGKVLEKKVVEVTRLKERHQKLDQVHKEGFYDLHSIFKNAKLGAVKRTKPDVNEEAGDRDSVPEHRLWGDKYL